MSKQFDEELTPEEGEAFRGIVREQAPPPFLEDRVVTALKREKLVNSNQPSSRSRFAYLGMAAAAAVLFFVLGGVAGMQWSRTGTPAASNAPRFMLVLRRGSDAPQTRSSEEVRKLVKEYGNWATELRRQGLMVGGEKLGQETRLLHEPGNFASAEKRADAGPESIAGYFLIEAQDFEQAMRIAAGCPHLKYGGTIEVRQIERL